MMIQNLGRNVCVSSHAKTYSQILSRSFSLQIIGNTADIITSIFYLEFSQRVLRSRQVPQQCTVKH